MVRQLEDLPLLREEIATALKAAGFHAVDYAAARLAPPAAVVVPGTPYLTDTDEALGFGQMTVRYDVLLIVGRADNEKAADDIDAQIIGALTALHEWDLTDVAQPGLVTLNGTQHLGTVLSIQDTIKLGAQ